MNFTLALAIAKPAVRVSAVCVVRKECLALPNATEGQAVLITLLHLVLIKSPLKRSDERQSQVMMNVQICKWWFLRTKKEKKAAMASRTPTVSGRQAGPSGQWVALQ